MGIKNITTGHSQLRYLHDHTEGLNNLLKSDRLGFEQGANNLLSCYILYSVSGSDLL